MLKMAVFAPMPSASAKIATAANPGFLRSRRKPKRVSRRKFAMLALSFSGQGNQMSPDNTHDSSDYCTATNPVQMKHVTRRNAFPRILAPLHYFPRGNCGGPERRSVFPFGKKSFRRMLYFQNHVCAQAAGRLGDWQREASRAAGLAG